MTKEYDISRKPRGIRSECFMHAADAAAQLGDRIVSLMQAKPDAVIGLATGSSPEPVYARIIERLAQAKAEGNPIDTSRLRFVALDEYAGLSPDHPQSYHRYLWDKILGPIGASPQNVYLPPRGDHPDLARACTEYEQTLSRLGGVDLWLVGLGPNGHIGFNEPPCSMNSRTHITALTPETIAANSRFFAPGEPQPTHAVTVGIGTLREHARAIAMIACGQSKAKPVATLLQGGVSHLFPASALAFHSDATLYTDQQPSPARGR